MIGLNFNNIIIKVEKKILTEIPLFNTMFNTNIPLTLDKEGNIMLMTDGGKICQINSSTFERFRQISMYR